MESTQQAGAHMAQRLHASIASLIDGNHMQGQELDQIAHRASACQLRYTVDWSFEPHTSESTHPGDTSVSTHHGFDRASYRRETAHRCEVARTHQPIRNGFIEKVLSQQGAGVADTDHAISMWDFGQHSVHEHCSPCNHTGKVRCDSCSGAGKKYCFYCHGQGHTVEHRYNHGRSESYRQPCYHCGQSGRSTCSSCRGSGKQQCATCKGHGYSTHITAIVVKAQPKVRISAQTGLSQQALLDFLCQQPAARIADQLDFRLSGHGHEGEHIWRAEYACEPTVIELDLALRGKAYTAAAVGERVWAFVRPPIFDDIFVEEITDLKKIWTGKQQRYSARRARQFFSAYAGQPVLDAALQAVAKLSTEQRQRSEQPVLAACQGYVSQASASVLGQSMLALLHKVSPPYSLGAWLLVMVLPLALLFLLAQGVLEAQAGTGLWNRITELFILGMGAVLLTLLLSPLAVLLSSLTSALRRRALPAEYRQAGRNWQLLPRFLKAALLVTALGAGCGALAHQGWLPRWHNAPMQLVAQWSEQLRSYSRGDQASSATAQPLAAPPQVQGLVPVQVKFRKNLLRDVQRNLQLQGYSLKVNGKLDTATERALASYVRNQRLLGAELADVQLRLCSQLAESCVNASQTQAAAR